MQAIKAIGRSDVYLKLESVKKIIELAVLLVVMWISVNAIVMGMAVCTTLFVFVNAYPNKKFINYTIKEQLLDILPSVLMSCVMFVCVYMVNYVNVLDWVKILMQVVIGIIVYVGLSVITKNAEFKQLKQICLEMIYKITHRNRKG